MTGDPAVADLLGRIASESRTRLGARYRSTYLWGSHARGDAIETSDIDVGVFVRGPLAEAEMLALEDAIRAAAGGDPRLDFGLVSGDALDGRDAVSFRHGAVHLDGEDLRDAAPLPSRDEWIDLSDEAALHFLGHRRTPPIARPLAPHDASDEFLGYVCRTLATADGRTFASTKEPLMVAGRIASAHVARASGRFVGDRPQAIRAYAADVGGPWAPFLADLEDTLRREWRYLVPAAADDRATLRSLCKRVLEFERDFVETIARSPRGPRCDREWRSAFGGGA